MNEVENNTPAKPALADRVRSLRLNSGDNGRGSDNGATGGWRTYLPWAICAILIGAVGVLALEAFSPLDDETVKKLAQDRGLNVGKGSESASNKMVIPGTQGTGSAAVEIALESKGNVVPFQLIQLSPKVTGTVMELFIKEGIAVKKGDLLAVLEKVEYQSDLDHAKEAREAAIGRLEMLHAYRPKESAQAKAELEDAASQLIQSDATYERAKMLKKTGGISPTEFEAAETSYLSLKARVVRLEIAYEFMNSKGPRDAQIAAAKADLKSADADLVKAQWRWDNTEIKAPISGIILSKKTELYNLVNPQAFSSGLSASLCEMADLYDLEIDLAIAERDLAKVFTNQECRIRAEAFPDRFYPGYVSRIMPMADRNKASVPVRVKVLFPATDKKGQPLPKEAQGEYLRPEMGAIVTFLNRKSKDADQPGTTVVTSALEIGKNKKQ